MSHIFISYARTDKDFVRKIVAALEAKEFNVWIDLDDIPKGEDWEQEIYRNINEAEAFLFMLSPDSVSSEMCNKEIAQAVANGKRILPIFIKNIEVSSVLEKFHHEGQRKEISKRNFIFCREEMDDFNEAINEIQVTIHTDYEWLKYHTKLQVMAHDWEQHKDESQLLRGKQLRNAEKQLAVVGSEKDPQPTDLQRQFIVTSQDAEKRQRRRAAIVRSIIVILFIVASIAGSILIDRTPAEVHVEDRAFEIRNRFGYRFLRKDVGSTISTYADPQRLVSDGGYTMVIGTGPDGDRPGTVLAYDMRGNIKWEYDANFDPYDGPTANFSIRRILIDQIMNDGESQIVFTSQKTDWFPSELVLLDADGNLLDSYWNSGFIYDVLPQDFDGDGIKELVVSAVNNNLGVLVVNDDTKHPAIVYVLSPKNDFTGQSFPDLIDDRPAGTEYNHWIAVLEPYTVTAVKVRIVQDSGENFIEIVYNPQGGYIHLDKYGRIRQVGLSDFWRKEYPDTSPVEFICFLQNESDDWYISARTDQPLRCPWFINE